MRIHKQEGMTLIGFILVLSIVIFVAFIGMKIGPIYMEYYSVIDAMNGVAAERGSANLPPNTIRTKIRDRLYISNTSYSVKNNDMTIVRRNGVHLRIAYEVRKPVIGNLDVVAKFDRSVRLTN